MKLSNFQIIVFALCVVFLLLGVGVFASFGGLLGGTSMGPVTIWGTVDQSMMSNLLTTLRASDKTFEKVQYVQKNASSYDSDLLNAMASGSGPDLFMITQDEIESFANKITPIPYSSLSQGQFTGSFIDEGQLFLTPQGSLALPFTVDPLVMYWNRDLFANAGVATAPVYWNDFLSIAPKISSLNGAADVQKSAVALGLWKNITNAKAILSTLFMQAGDPLVMRNQDGSLLSVFGQTPQGAPANPAESALRFYTEFANPSKTSYSWNASLPKSSDAFAAGSLAAYMGFASEYQAIANRNPNLEFSVALLPQLKGNTVHLTFGQMTGIALSRTAANPQGGVLVAEHLTGQQAIAQLVQAIALPPVRRDVIFDTSNNAAMQVFVQSSLIAHAWLDPNPTQSNSIFQQMVETTVSGASEPATAISDASQALSKIISP